MPVEVELAVKALAVQQGLVVALSEPMEQLLEEMEQSIQAVEPAEAMVQFSVETVVLELSSCDTHHGTGHCATSIQA